MCGIELYLNNAFWYMLGSIISIIIFKLGSVSEVYKIQVNDSEPIEVSKQVYEVSFCFNEMLKEKDKEIERLNNIINDLVRFAWGTDMSINEFNALYEMAYNKEFEGFED